MRSLPRSEYRFLHRPGYTAPISSVSPRHWRPGTARYLEGGGGSEPTACGWPSRRVRPEVPSRCHRSLRAEARPHRPWRHGRCGAPVAWGVWKGIRACLDPSGATKHSCWDPLIIQNPPAPLPGIRQPWNQKLVESPAPGLARDGGRPEASPPTRVMAELIIPRNILPEPRALRTSALPLSGKGPEKPSF